MSDAERALKYSEGVLERLRAAHAGRSAEELLDLVCQLTKTYVLDQTIPYDIPLPERAAHQRADPPDVPPAPSAASEEEDETEPTHARFSRLVEGLKARTRLPQFQGFQRGPDGRMILLVDNQKITFGERVTVEFLPRSSPRPSGSGQILDDSDDQATPLPGAPSERVEAPTPAPSPAPVPVPTPAPIRPPARPATRLTPGAPANASRPVPGSPTPAAAPAAAAPPPARPAPELETPSPESLDDVDHVVERFRGLELD